MARSSLRGKARIKRLIRRLPDTVAGEIVTELYVTGRAILNAVLARTPRKSGATRAAIRMKVLPKSMRLQIGLIGSVAERRDVFYARIQDLGRKAQVVLVQRRRRVESDLGKHGKFQILRTHRGRKVAEDISSTYRMNVPGMEGKRFVTGRYPDLRNELRRNLTGIFSRSLRTAAGGDDE